MKAAILGVLLCAALAAPVEVCAKEGSSVTVVSPPHAAPLVEEAVIRLSAELRAAGFLVRVVEGVTGRDGRAQVEGDPIASPSAAEPFATIAIMTTDRGAVADMWVADHVTKKTLVRRVDIGDAGATNAASDLAVRSVELLRASLLEVGGARTKALPTDLRNWIEAPKAAPSPPPRAPAPAPPPPPLPTRAPPPRRPIASLEAAFAVLGGGHFGVTPLPLLRLAAELFKSLSLRASVAPAVMPATLSASAGTVALQQTVAALDLAYAFGLDRGRLYPVVSLGGGLYYLQFDGQAIAPQHGQQGSFLTATFVTGAGLGVNILPNLTALADLQLVALQTQPYVTITGTTAGYASRATLLPSIGLLAHF